jgi:hypothetical protein
MDRNSDTVPIVESVVQKGAVCTLKYIQSYAVWFWLKRLTGVHTLFIPCKGLCVKKKQNMFRGFKVLMAAAMLLPSVAMSIGYSYNKVITTDKGSDGFGVDRSSCVNVSGGQIALEGNNLTIDSVSYILKPKPRDGVYRSQHCTFEMVYNNDDRLKLIKMIRLNRTTSYFIDIELMKGTEPETDRVVKGL